MARSNLPSASAMPEAFEAWLEELEHAQGRSPHTLRAYRKDIGAFLESLPEAERAHPEALGSAELEGWLARRAAEGLQTRSLRRHASALRGWFRWMQRRGLREDNPGQALELPRAGRPLPKVIGLAQVEALLEVAGGTSFADLRDRALLETLYSAGVRVSELVALDLSDLDLDRARARVLGKGRKERIVHLGGPARRALEAWLTLAIQRRKEAAGAAVFLNTRGGRLSDRSVRRILQRRLIEAGLPSDVSPHTLRHAFATHLLRAGANLKEVQQLLGHAWLSSTEVYTHLEPEQLRQAYEEAHPRARAESR